MWFAKWFGGASEVEEEDEPARHSAPTLVRPPAPALSQTVRPTASKAHPPRHAKKGFDPYNSGAFERRNAWERIQRR